VPPPRHSPIVTFLNGVPARLRPSLLRLIVLLFVLCFIWFPCILFPLFFFFFFCLFSLYFVFVGFPCIWFSSFLYCFSLFVSCVFLVFTVLPIFFALVSPLSVHCWAFFHALTASSFQCVLQCTRSACT
jgi:hypothetical protein